MLFLVFLIMAVSLISSNQLGRKVLKSQASYEAEKKQPLRLPGKSSLFLVSGGARMRHGNHAEVFLVFWGFFGCVIFICVCVLFVCMFTLGWGEERQWHSLCLYSILLNKALQTCNIPPYPRL